jgi:hypothetical protein
MSRLYFTVKIDCHSLKLYKAIGSALYCLLYTLNLPDDEEDLLKIFFAGNIDLPWTRVARWHIFKPKIPIWVNFCGSWNRRCWCISYVQMVYFEVI